MKKIKKLMSLSLAVVMAFSVFFAVPGKAFAAGKTIKDFSVKNITLIEGTGYLVHGVMHYDYWYKINAIVILSDDTTGKYTGGACVIGGESFEASLTDDQWENPWGVGTHTAKLSLGGVEREFTVEIKESPIASIEVNPVTLIEGTGYDNGDYMRYYYESDYIVIYKDGSRHKRRAYESVEIYGEYYSPNYIDDQRENPWGVGTHTVKMQLAGVETEFTVEIIPSPVKKITMDKQDLFAGIDGWYQEIWDDETEEYIPSDQFYYAYDITGTVELNDGEILQIQNGGVEYKGKGYYLSWNDSQEEKAWDIGKHTITGTFMGTVCEVEIEVVANPYVALSLSSDGRTLYLQKKDGTKEQMQVQNFEAWGGDEGVTEGILTTDKHTFTDAIWWYYYDEDKDTGNCQEDCNREVSLQLGNMKSNTLSRCGILRAYTFGWDIMYESVNVQTYMKSSELYPEFAGYNGVVTENNLDALIFMALNCTYSTCEPVEAFDENGSLIEKYSFESVQMVLKNIFGLTNVDLTKAKGYNPEEPNLVAVRDRVMYYPYLDLMNYDVAFKNNSWIVEVYCEDRENVDKECIRVTLNVDGEIKRIEFLKGDEEPEVDFPDVPEGAWFTEAVQDAVQRGIFKGYDNGCFGPADNIQRQDFLVVLARLDGVDLSSYATKEPKFVDVPQGSYYYAAVAWGAENGIVTGYNDGRFGTGDQITREQILTFFYRYAKYKGLDISVSEGAEAKYASTYTDFGTISTFAKDAVVWALEKGAISGKTPTTVVPVGSASRAEVAKMFLNIKQKSIF